MEQKIIHDITILQTKSTLATPKDIQIVNDLRDTFIANADKAAGLAANMIGQNKQIIVISFSQLPVIMINPQIISQSGAYETQEGCLSLTGIRNAKRYQHIKVKYKDINFKDHTDTFDDFIAQVIQHEIDHCNGILI